jgi:hypothetical protein
MVGPMGQGAQLAAWLSAVSPRNKVVAGLAQMAFAWLASLAGASIVAYAWGAAGVALVLWGFVQARQGASR